MLVEDYSKMFILWSVL